MREIAHSILENNYKCRRCSFTSKVFWHWVRGYDSVNKRWVDTDVDKQGFKCGGCRKELSLEDFRSGKVLWEEST